MKTVIKSIAFILLLILPSWVFAEAAPRVDVTETDKELIITPVAPGSTSTTTNPGRLITKAEYEDPLNYTLGAEDIVEITVMRHPEFSGVYPINQEGKLQYKFVCDLDVDGLTKKQLEDKVKEIIANFVITPEVNVTVVEYRSKIIYVLGEVGQPGKYYLRSEKMPVREVVVQAGLPTSAAAMRKCRIITPSLNGKVKTRKVDLYTILYGGDLRKNVDMHTGEVLYVPSTVMTKLLRMISPVTATVQGAASAPTGAAQGKTATSALAK